MTDVYNSLKEGKLFGLSRGWTIAIIINIIILIILAVTYYVKIIEAQKAYTIYEADCQNLSNLYGMYADRNMGTAPPELQATWLMKNCRTKSTNKLDCLQMKEMYNINKDNVRDLPWALMNEWMGRGCDYELYDNLMGIEPKNNGIPI